MRRLILKCRSLETKLEQSVPKKSYQDAVAKLQANIDRLTEDLQRTKDELGRTESLGGRLNNLSTVVLTLSSQISAQNDTIRMLTEKYQVPQDLHNRALTKIKDLESSLVKKSAESEAARARIAELEAKLEESIPKEKYSRLMDQISGLVSLSGEFSFLPDLQHELAHDGVSSDVPLNGFPTQQAPGPVISTSVENTGEKIERPTTPS